MYVSCIVSKRASKRVCLDAFMHPLQHGEIQAFCHWVLCSADPNTGNILNFNVGQNVDFLVPRVRCVFCWLHFASCAK